jgi:dipeptidyl aminopeptidase/acylaminoacyl peptidase
MVHPERLAPQAVAFNHFKLEWKPTDPETVLDFAALAEKLPGELRIRSRDRADQQWTVAQLRADASPRVYLYDRNVRRTEFLFVAHPALEGYRLAPVEPRTIVARDGLELPAYLTCPPDEDPTNLPLVLAVHGGPWWRNRWELDPWVQQLANRGYAVLSVNFRGSRGFGKRFLNAGNLQWAAAMQHDLTDAVQWAIDEGIADRTRIAIAGASYGGYAALCGLAFTPDLYACGIDIVGCSEVRKLLAAGPFGPSARENALRVGDVEHDDELNWRISPLYHASRVRRPLLIIHGEKDPRCNIEQSDMMVAALRRHASAVTYVVYPDEGHGFIGARFENRLDFAARTEAFLAQHLGGRCEPWQQVAGSSAQVR